MTTLHLKSGLESRIKNGHRWAFAGEISESLKELKPGDEVALCEARGALLGRGYVNPHSLIAVRLLTSGEEPFDAGLVRRRIEAAIAYRRRLLPEEDAVRLIYSESDGLPGLIVDKFGDQLVMQVLTAGMEKRLGDVVEALTDSLKPAGIYFKGKSPFRKLEGLVEEDRQIMGVTPDNVPFKDGDAIFTAHPKEGQKSGYYLDQRFNRRQLATCFSIEGLRPARVLDLYSYTGGWGITALMAGAKEAVMVDSSAKAIAWGKEDAGNNGVDQRAIFIEADVEEFLKDAAKSNTKWDVVVVDPPALIPNRQAVQAGIGAYTAINRAALRVVAPGGLLVTCSCSHLMTREKHLEVIGRAAFQEGKRVRIVAAGGHPPDHPILPGHPESEYLKCWIVGVE